MSWQRGSFWEAWSCAGHVCRLSPRCDPFAARHPAELAGRQRVLRLHSWRIYRLDALLAAPAVSVLGDVRCRGSGGGDRRRGGTNRVLLERLLRWRRVQLTVGRPVSGRIACLARQINAGLLPPEATGSLPVHPTQLYAALAAFLVLAILLAYYPRQRRHGEIMALLMIFYPLTRWPIECLRGDEPALLAGMTLGQNISMGLFAGGIAVWLILKRRIDWLSHNLHVRPLD